MNNKVELLGFYGSDEIISCSAWTSTSRDLTPAKRERIPKLLNDLWGAGHETPFEKAMVHFLVDCDIASHIHLLRHRVSSLNAESARYKELKEDKYYLPADFNLQVADKHKNTNYLSHLQETNQYKAISWELVLDNYTRLGNRLYHNCLEDLTPILGRKRAKESARYFKTYNSQIQADVSFNMRNFANFLKLRNSEHAQLEIKEIAAQMLDLVSKIEGNPFEHTLIALQNRK